MHIILKRYLHEPTLTFKVMSVNEKSGEWKGRRRVFLKYIIITVCSSFFIGQTFNITSSYKTRSKNAIDGSLANEMIASPTDEIYNLKEVNLREKINNTKPGERQKRQERYDGRLIHDVTLPFNITMFRPWLAREDEGRIYY